MREEIAGLVAGDDGGGPPPGPSGAIELVQYDNEPSTLAAQVMTLAAGTQEGAGIAILVGGANLTSSVTSITGAGTFTKVLGQGAIRHTELWFAPSVPAGETTWTVNRGGTAGCNITLAEISPGAAARVAQGVSNADGNTHKSFSAPQAIAAGELVMAGLRANNATGSGSSWSTDPEATLTETTPPADNSSRNAHAVYEFDAEGAGAAAFDPTYTTSNSRSTEAVGVVFGPAPSAVTVRSTGGEQDIAFNSSEPHVTTSVMPAGMQIGDELVLVLNRATPYSGDLSLVDISDDAGNTYTLHAHQKDSNTRWVLVASATLTAVPTSITINSGQAGNFGTGNLHNNLALLCLTPCSLDVVGTATGTSQTFQGANPGLDTADGVVGVEGFSNYGDNNKTTPAGWSVWVSGPRSAVFYAELADAVTGFTGDVATSQSRTYAGVLAFFKP